MRYHRRFPFTVTKSPLGSDWPNEVTERIAINKSRNSVRWMNVDINVHMIRSCVTPQTAIDFPAQLSIKRRKAMIDEKPDYEENAGPSNDVSRRDFVAMSVAAGIVAAAGSA